MKSKSIAFAFCRLDAVAHGGNPQDRAASLLPFALSSPRFMRLMQEV
ncbi:hypothetical protein [Moorena producens]